MHEDLRVLEAELTGGLALLSSQKTQATPAELPQKWSVQEIVEHLLLSYRSTSTVFQARLDRGSPTRARPTLRQRLAQFTIVSLGRFPTGFKAPAAVFPSRPDCVRTGPELAERVHIELARVDELARQAEALFGNQRAISHMVLGPLSVGHWLRFHLVHGRHHLQQIRRIRRDHDF